MAKLDDLARTVGDDWKSSVYYEEAENPEWLSLFWAEHGPFRRFFSALDLSCVLELACGHGRHSSMLERFAGRIILMDINEENIAACERRFAGNDRFRIIKNDGFTFSPVGDNECSAIISYDSMVHFDSEVVFSYLRDAFRVLAPGGMALFHHSNYVGNPGGDYRENPHWRNFMSQALFCHYARKAGLELIKFELLDWGAQESFIRGIDCLSLVQKPSSPVSCREAIK